MNHHKGLVMSNPHNYLLNNLPNHKNGFTFLRLLAAFSVVFTHSYVSLGLGEDPLQRLTHLTAVSGIGVDMFFAISGFLICSSLLRQPSPAIYLRNRLLRIIPALSVIIILTVFIVGPWTTVDIHHYWSSSSTYAYLLNITLYGLHLLLPGTFTTNPVPVPNGSIWTLPIEMTCYLGLLGLSWSRALNWRMLLLLFLGFLALHLSSVFAQGQAMFSMGLLHLNRLSTIFLAGALLATLRTSIKFSVPLALLALTLIILTTFGGLQHWRRFALIYITFLPYIVVSFAFALKRLDWLNKYDFSYGFYLYGFLVQQCCVHALGTHMTVTQLTALSCVITFVCAMLSWFLVEKPALRMKKISLSNKETIDPISVVHGSQLSFN